MKNLTVNIPGREYEIHIASGLLNRVGEEIRQVYQGEKIALVTDSNVKSLYGEDVKKRLEQVGFETELICVPAGETSKSQEQLFFLYDRMLEFGITRTDLIVALGGGVVGDLAGYAAASLLRGIPFVQIPTTLLAQVDSSVGGKVAIDLPCGKNLVGAFYQPKRVLIDPLCLQTLPERVLADGMAEVIKYGAIRDASLFETLERIATKEKLFAKIEEIIYTCCNIKRQIVEADELDTGERMILNFGHTFGHAIEKEYHYTTYTHGEAVGIGMVLACEYAEKMGICDTGISRRMEKILQNYHLPIRAELSRDGIRSAVAVDKKGDGEHIRLILLTEIGNAVGKKVKKSEI